MASLPRTTLGVAISLCLPVLLGAASTAADEWAPLTPRAKAIHALNRLAFGPRPGDVDRVLTMGVNAWIEEQLNPERISDTAVEAKLQRFPTLALSSAELFDRFERPMRDIVRERKDAAAKTDKAAGSGDAMEAELEKARAMIRPEERPRRILDELSASRVLRAAYSQRQLNEVMVDFWMNHFNVFANKGLDRVFITSFERDVVRPHLWGRFEDLLMATAKSSAMLFYLDNAQSTADPEHRPAARGRRALTPRSDGMQEKKKKSGGLNENYARELMELHTLGVDGGYTQTDVTELARVLTGWSIDRQGEGPGPFLFRPRVHDVGQKTVLGYTLPPGGGIEEGEKMIGVLAHHPSTAHHIAFELCQRLVADDPPPALVDRAASKFLVSDGDLRQTVRTIIESSEFFDPRFYRAKVKSPFHYVVSAVRAAGGETDGAVPLTRAMAQMGEPLYLCQPPTGYSNVSSAWINTGSLVARLNFSLALAANRLPGTQIDIAKLLTPESAAEPTKSVAALARALTGDDLTPGTLQTIERRLTDSVESREDPSANTQLPLIAGLVLGSPEFQKQ